MDEFRCAANLCGLAACLASGGQVHSPEDYVSLDFLSKDKKGISSELVTNV